MPIPINADWDSVQETRGGDIDRLPPGGYVAHIVQLTDISDQTGDYLLVEFDIANDRVNGKYAGYYRNLYERFGDWNGRFRIYYNTPKRGETLGRLKAFKTDLERSNGINIRQFDAKTLAELANQRKLFGVLMGYDKKAHKYLNVYQTCDIQTIRDGKFEIPEEWKVKREQPPANGGYGGYGGNQNNHDYDRYRSAPPGAEQMENPDDYEEPF